MPDQVNLSASQSPRSRPTPGRTLIARSRAFYLRARLNRRPVLYASAGVLIILLAGATWAGVEASKTVVPDLTGLSMPAAAATFDDVDLVPRVAGAPDAEELNPFTVVVSQDPAPGARVFPGRAVNYSVDLVEVTVPDLTGDTWANVRDELQTVGLALGPAQAQLSIAEESGQQGVSAGADPDTVVAAAHELGLSQAIDTSGKPFSIQSRPADDWQVAAVSPEPGTKVVAGTSVDVTLALPLTQVPDVVGRPYGEAEELLEVAGLTPSQADTPYFNGTTPRGFVFDLDELAYSTWGGRESDTLELTVDKESDWIVHAQSLDAGTVVLAGSDVGLTATWPSAKVPDLIGKTEAEVYDALNSVGLAAYDGLDGEGTVRAQSVSAGTVLPQGASVGTKLRHEVTFRVTSSASRGMVTWVKPDSFSIEQASDTELPWSKSWYLATEPGSYEHGNLNAQMHGSGTISCAIELDGKVIEKSNSAGPYAVVSCN